MSEFPKLRENPIKGKENDESIDKILNIGLTIMVLVVLIFVLVSYYKG